MLITIRFSISSKEQLRKPRDSSAPLVGSDIAIYFSVHCCLVFNKLHDSIEDKCNCFLKYCKEYTNRALTCVAANSQTNN